MFQTSSIFQMSRAYSAIVRSLENFPMRATFKIAIRVQAPGYRSHQLYVALTAMEIMIVSPAPSPLGQDPVSGRICCKSNRGGNTAV